MEYNAFLMSRNPLGANNADGNNDAGGMNGAVGNMDAMIDESYLPSDITAYFALAQMTSLRKISFPECLVREYF